MFANGYLKHYL